MAVFVIKVPPELMEELRKEEATASDEIALDRRLTRRTRCGRCVDIIKIDHED